MINFKAFLALVFLSVLTACQDSGSAQNKPLPIALTSEAAGHYCQMVILEHEGPKAQIHLAGFEAPIWFSQVRDGIAYLKSPEQSADLVALYVNDMGEAISWSEPGEDNWIDVEDAYFVVGSDAVGGMGAPELVPFADLTKAEDFAAARGGEVLRLSEISVETVLSPVENQTIIPEEHG